MPRIEELTAATTWASADVLPISQSTVAKKATADLITGYFNALHYGAVGDGVTESGAEIQAAIDACFTAGGGVVYLPEGIYLCEVSPQIKTGVVLRGAGWKTVLKLKNSGTAGLSSPNTILSFVYSDTATDFGIVDLYIDGNDANNNSTLFTGLTIANSSRYFLRNIKISDCYGSASAFSLSSEFTVSDIYITDITGAAGNPGEGFYVRKSYNGTFSGVLAKDLDDHLLYFSGTAAERSHDINVSNCVGINCGRTSGSSAFNCLDGVDRVTFNACKAYDCAKGFTIIGTADAVNEITYIGCEALHSDGSNPNGFTISSSSGVKHADITFIGCRAHKSGIGAASIVGYGYNLNDITNLRMLHCIATENNYDGLWLRDITGLQIIGGAYNDNGQDPNVSSRTGIRVSDSASGPVTDGLIAHVAARDNQHSGIYLRSQASDIIVIGGDYRGNPNFPINKDSNTPASCVVLDAPLNTDDTLPSRVYSDAAPSADTWGVGDLTLNDTPAAGAPVGWLCTTAGTPGTWTSFGQVGYRSGSGSPSGSVTPNFVGEEWLDTTGNAWYKAYGLTNTSWQAL